MRRSSARTCKIRLSVKLSPSYHAPPGLLQPYPSRRAVLGEDSPVVCLCHPSSHPSTAAAPPPRSVGNPHHVVGLLLNRRKLETLGRTRSVGVRTLRGGWWFVAGGLLKEKKRGVLLGSPQAGCTRQAEPPPSLALWIIGFHVRALTGSAHRLIINHPVSGMTFRQTDTDTRARNLS